MSVILFPVMSKKKPPSVKVKKSSAGLGLYAMEDIKKEAFIIEYIGEKITTDESDRRGGKYLFTLSKDYVIDGKGRTNIARYINHSCRPNSEVEIDEDKWTISVYAKKNIKAGDELTYDYGKEYWNEHIKPYGCKCAKCTEKK
ncbi:hypothetical protein COU16_02885 [Candidatus Kaiserbacteria bacterium CG10_big_fil_rev_8_21_14_0_10_47_16]|uniref:SET domain-containing protein n=1 Tax=Candidatus Kaiserbacteria bacterium CG10_big_fil_rev_8_21_14_0_10_47_16 TaxID=1974608 RepID=A0A2H0UFP4_9BACT|nr:MAG: hypothetical protein COU16_02885 [Candidatus Kaiserbacteria bacterium CG10_big_fil_rev_8_21_14_0_10_47_16]